MTNLIRWGDLETCDINITCDFRILVCGFDAAIVKLQAIVDDWNAPSEPVEAWTDTGHHG